MEQEAGHPPLRGVRVLTLAVNLSDPVAVSRLTAMVATGVEAEPTTGDPLARMTPGYYEDLSAGQGAAMIAGIWSESLRRRPPSSGRNGR